MDILPGNLANGFTIYRLVAAPVLFLLLLTDNLDWFKWMLPISFLSDALDGFLARKYKAISVVGARLDSIADQLTILAAIAGLFLFKSEFIQHQSVPIFLLLGLYLLQNVMAIIRYRKISSFHTYLAKSAAICQALFFVLLFFTSQFIDELFYITVVLTAVALVEEIILVLILPTWEVNVKGLYWVLYRKPSD